MKNAKAKHPDDARNQAEWELVRQYQESNEAAFLKLLEQLGIYDSNGRVSCHPNNFVYRFFSQCWCTRNDAENFTQEVVSRLVTALKRFEYKAGVRTFIHRICLNTYLEQSRRKHVKEVKVLLLIQLFLPAKNQAREETAPIEIFDTLAANDPEKSALDELITEERKQILRNCVAGLPNENWRLVASLRLEGLKFKQIAQMLGKRIGAVNGWWARAFEALKKCVQAFEAGESHHVVSSRK